MLKNRAVIRSSRPHDAQAIAELGLVAFGRPKEAEMALKLIAGEPRTISLVAECNRRVVGHVLLSEVGAPVPSMALAPLSVHPDFREMQIGTSLVREAIARARKAGFKAVFVLGDNGYYERFGFSSPKADAFDVPWQGNHYMALELAEDALAGLGGPIVYPPQFMGSDY